MRVIERSTAPTAEQTLGDVVYDQMLELVADGTWAPRSRLPSEAALAAHFAVSRPVVRQALARLRNDGFISSRQGSGSFVNDVVRLHPEVTLPSIGSIADLERFLSFRVGVEGEAAATAAVTHSPERREQLRRTAEVRSVAPEEDFEFHLAVARASENPFYVNTMISLREQLLFGMRLASSFADRRYNLPSLIAEQHAAIAEAILAGEPAEARERMRRHLNWSRNRILTGSIDK